MTSTKFTRRINLTIPTVFPHHTTANIIFFEEVNNTYPVGFISVIEVFKNGYYSVPTSILQLSYHLSYPCVFKIKNDCYMIPETVKNRTVELWKCVNFPYNSVKHSTLLSDIEAVDTTPLLHNGIWYLFTSTYRNCKKLEIGKTFFVQMIF